MGKPKNKYKTRSIFLASYLHLRGFPIIDVENSITGEVSFVFESSEDLVKAEFDFFQNKELQSFITSYKYVKNLMFFCKQKGEGEEDDDETKYQKGILAK